jgi:iron-sulfur cluster repair protein YtfE (RIC family)
MMQNRDVTLSDVLYAVQQIDAKVDGLEKRLTEKIDAVENRLDKVESRLDAMESRLDLVEEGQRVIIEAIQHSHDDMFMQKKELTGLSEKVQQLHDDVSTQEKELTETSRTAAYLSRDVLLLKNRSSAAT